MDRLQTPRPTKENMKEAYRATWGGIWNSGLDLSVAARMKRQSDRGVYEPSRPVAVETEWSALVHTNGMREHLRRIPKPNRITYTPTMALWLLMQPTSATFRSASPAGMHGSAA